MKFVERILNRTGEMEYSSEVDDFREPPSRYSQAKQLAGGASSRKILDVGCWTGGLLRLFEGTNSSLVGVDIKGPWLDSAQKMTDASFISVNSYEEIP